MLLSLTLISLAYHVYGLPPSYTNSRTAYADYVFISRAEWGANPPISVTPLNYPVPLVIIHHTYIPGACYTTEECGKSMRSIQNVHQSTNGFADIGYSFAVGGDGAVYEGRGWETLGAHALGSNHNSIGIVLIGDWISSVPPANQLETTKKLIATGVELGYISADYKLLGHRQVRSTQCPGDALFAEISTWDRFSINP